MEDHNHFSRLEKSNAPYGASTRHNLLFQHWWNSTGHTARESVHKDFGRCEATQRPQVGSPAGTNPSWPEGWDWLESRRRFIFLFVLGFLGDSFMSETGQGRSPQSPSLPALLFTSPTWQNKISALQLPFLPSHACTHAQTHTRLSLWVWGSTRGTYCTSSWLCTCMCGLHLTGHKTNSHVPWNRTSPASPFVGLTAHQKLASNLEPFYSLVRSEWFDSHYSTKAKEGKMSWLHFQPLKAGGYVWRWKNSGRGSSNLRGRYL